MSEQQHSQLWENIRLAIAEDDSEVCAIVTDEGNGEAFAELTNEGIDALASIAEASACVYLDEAILAFKALQDARKGDIKGVRRQLERHSARYLHLSDPEQIDLLIEFSLTWLRADTADVIPVKTEPGVRETGKIAAITKARNTAVTGGANVSGEA